MQLILPDKNKVVKKGNSLLTARYQLSELAIKLITLIYSNIKEEDPVDKLYEIKVKDVADLLNKRNKKVYSELKIATKELIEESILIEDKENNKWEMFSWVSGAKCEKGIISFYISPGLKPYVLDIKKNYLKYQLRNILRLKGKYVIRMYEMLKNTFNLADKYNTLKEKLVTIEEFRNYIGAPESYIWGGSSGLRNRIVESAKKQFKEKTDIYFDYKEIKKGKKVYAIKFIIYKNKDNEDNEKKEFPDFKEFVNIIREKYTGTGKYFGFKTINNTIYWLGIDFYGLMFAIDDNGEEKELTPKESKELYKTWFKVVNVSTVYQDILKNSKNIKEELLNPEKRTQFNEEVKNLKEN